MKTIIIMHSFSAVFCVSIFFLIHNLEIYGFSGRSSSHFSACFSFRFSFFQKSFPFENFLVKMENQFLWQDPVPSSSPASTKFYTLIPHNICIFPHKQLAGAETRISRPPTKKNALRIARRFFVRVSRKISGDLWQARTADLLVVTQVLSQLS